MIILSLEQLLQLHVLVLQATGGGEGLRDLGRLEAVIAVQTQSVFGEDLYLTLSDKAAAMTRSIIADHPFLDGNKRTAMIAGLTLLSINGAFFTAKPGEIEDFAVKIAVDRLDVTAISTWIQARIIVP